MTTITSTELGATGRYIDLGSPAALDDLAAMTVVAYCRPTGSGGGGFAYIFGKTTSGAQDGPRLFINHFSGSPFPAFGASSSGFGGQPNCEGAVNSVVYNSWQHITATWDGSLSATGIQVYVGATNVSSTRNSGGGAIVSDASKNAFVLNRAGLAREFVGDLGYVAVWNRVLDSTERATVISNGPLDVPSGLVLLWANEADLSASAITPAGRSAFVAGGTPPNTALGGSADTTAPALSSPAGVGGTLSCTGSVSTDEGNGTLYAVVTASATAPSAAQVKAGQDHAGTAALRVVSQAVSSAGGQSIGSGSVTAGTRYWHFMHEDAASNQSAIATSASFAVGATDTTPPVLSSPTAVATGSTAATVGAATDEGNGTLYAVVTGGATQPSVAQIKAGQTHSGAVADWAGSVAVSSAGAKTLNATGLTAATTYYAHLVHADAAGNDSNRLSSASFTTSAAAIRGARITLYDGITARASLAGLTACWWDSITPHTWGAPDLATNTESTDAAGVLQIDISAVTSLAIGAKGFLLIYKADGTNTDNSLVFAGQVPVVDIS